MPEFLTLLPPEEARRRLLSHLPAAATGPESIDAISALGRVAFEDLRAPHPLPEFSRSSVDGYAVRAADTFGAGDALPAYFHLVGESPMGAVPEITVGPGQCALIHTGGMLPEGADSVVMLEFTQAVKPDEVEVTRAAAPGENVILRGEDVEEGGIVLDKGRILRPAEIGGLLALGIARLRVAKKARAGLISTGDEVVEPGRRPRPGQVRDVNSYTLSALVEKFGGEAVRYGVIPDAADELSRAAAQALVECDLVIITAGSSASARDMTAGVIEGLGRPGVLVHGINTRPGKPTILGVCSGKAVIGLPGNPVSALVNGYLFVAPVIEKLMGAASMLRPSIRARLTINLPSQAGREDWWPVRLASSGGAGTEIQAEPIFGKSNLIFTLAAAYGLIRIPPDSTGLSAGETVEIFPL